MDESIPVLPHLPAVESWREGTQTAALHRSPRLQTLDDALETYETSFRRYSAISQTYYQALAARPDEAGPSLTAQSVTARDLAESAYSRAVHDFEAVEIAFSAWVNNGDVSLAAPLARQLDDQLSLGRSQLALRSAVSGLSQPREAPTTGTSTTPTRGPKLSLRPRR
jgi:hypothetical protein